MYLITQRYINDKQQKEQKNALFSISRLGWFEMIVFFFVVLCIVLLVEFIGWHRHKKHSEKKKKERKKLKRAQVNNFNNKNLLSLSKCYYNNIVNKQIKNIKWDLIFCVFIFCLLFQNIVYNKVKIYDFAWSFKNILLTIF